MKHCATGEKQQFTVHESQRTHGKRGLLFASTLRIGESFVSDTTEYELSELRVWCIRRMKMETGCFQ